MSEASHPQAQSSNPAESETTPGSPRRRRWPWVAAGGAALVIAAFAVAAATGVFNGTAATTPEAAPTTAPTQTTSPPTMATPTPTPTETTPPPSLPPAEVNISSVRHMAYSPVWNPPDNGEYFWQIVDPSHGYPETGGTDFLLAHACESQTCAGDALRTLNVGDTLTYQGEVFVIQDKREIMKTEIAAQDIWFHDPNRIVIITCIIETTWDQSDKNDLFIATRYTG